MNVDPELTRDADLADWRVFCQAYYGPIVRALKMLRVPEVEIDELAHGFLVRAAEKNFLDTFKAYQRSEAEAGRRASFRKYLYGSLRNAARDFQRARTTRLKERGLSAEAAETLEASPERCLDSDAVYALDILHQALQALRRHCERTGKPHLWIIFEELLLAEEFRGRRARTRPELLAAFGRDDPQFLDNALTTAKRAFRRIIQQIIPRLPGDGLEPSERFSEWMATLRDSNASQFNLLHHAYRVMPYLGDASQAPSMALVVPEGLGAELTGLVYEPPSPTLDDDALGVFISFSLETPLTRLLDVTDLAPEVPSSSPLGLRPPERLGPRHASVPQRSPALERPLCLLTLIEPNESERRALAEVDVVGLLVRVKSLAKQLRRKGDLAVPEAFAEMIYTTVNVVALVGYGATIHSIGSTRLASNIRVFLGRPWIDERLRPLFQAALASLGDGPET